MFQGSERKVFQGSEMKGGVGGGENSVTGEYAFIIYVMERKNFNLILIQITIPSDIYISYQEFIRYI